MARGEGVVTLSQCHSVTRGGGDVIDVTSVIVVLLLSDSLGDKSRAVEYYFIILLSPYAFFLYLCAIIDLYQR
jgi:hypothetical protein